MIRRNRQTTTLAAFLEDAVPIKGVTWGSAPAPSAADDARGIPRQHPVVVLDLAQHPDISITDLSRVYRTDMPAGEGPVEFAWDFWLEPGNEKCRLLVAYAVPVALEFSLVFSCTDAEQWNLLRWIIEHQGRLTLADEAAEALEPESDEHPLPMLLLEMEGADEELAAVLCRIKIGEAARKKGRALTGFDVAMKAFEAKRFLSFPELAALLNVCLHLPLRGKASLLVHTFDSHTRIPLKGISPQLKQVVQQLAHHTSIRVGVVNGHPCVIRRDWLHEAARSEAATERRRWSELPHQLLEEVTADTVPVVRIREPEQPSQSGGGTPRSNHPVAVLDCSQQPKINLRELASHGAFLPEAPTTFEWTLAERVNDVLVLLTCTCPAPASAQFVLLFSYGRHQRFLRWVCEHEQVVPIADQRWIDQEEVEQPVLLHATKEKLATSVSLLLIHQILTRQEREPETKELITLLFAVRRFLPLSELAEFAEEMLNIPIRGTEEQMIANATEGPNAAMIVQQLSREYRILLLQVLTLGGITSGMYQGEPHLMTEDWLAEQAKEA